MFFVSKWPPSPTGKMVSITKTAIVNPSLANFMTPVFNSSSVYRFILYGLLYENKSTPGISLTFENNFTTMGTNSFHFCSCWYSFFSATFHPVTVGRIVLLPDIKLEPAKPDRVCHLALFSKKKKWFRSLLPLQVISC